MEVEVTLHNISLSRRTIESHSRNRLPREKTIMTTDTDTAPAPAQEQFPTSVSENPAVARCRSAWWTAYRHSEENDKGVFPSVAAHRAFREAMPPLAGAQNIRDFIACVAYGMLIRAIEGPDAARLLYAAQIAHAAVQRDTTKQKNRRA